MAFFKKFILTLASCCLVLCSCGRTDNDSDAPDGIIDIEVTTEPESDTSDNSEDIVTTTKSVIDTEFVWTTTTVKTAKPYHAGANNNYIPRQTTASSKTSGKRTTTAKRSVVTGKNPGKNPAVTTNANQHFPGSGTGAAVTAATTAVTTVRRTTPPVTTSTTTKSPQIALLDDMTLEEKVCQMFIVSPEQLTGKSGYSTEADKDLKNGLEKYHVGGIIFSEGNLESKNQITAMIRNLQTASKSSSGTGIFTLIQEEGGDIAPAANKLGIKNPGSMASIGEKNDEKAAYNAGNELGSELKNLGFNVDLAPIADLGTNSKNGLGSRVFGSDAEKTARMISNIVKGFSDSGIASALSHFPGEGAYDGRSALIKRSLSQLRKEEFLPFSSGINAGADFVLVSHHIVSGIGDNLPCDLSYTAITGILRNELGFDGIVITDSHKASAITKKYSSGEAAVMAVNAGADIILLPDDLPSAVKAVCEAVENGEIRESRINESVTRILNLKAELGLIK